MQINTQTLALTWNKDNQYVCWGAGRHGMRFLNRFKDKLQLAAVIDSNPDKKGTSVEGIPIIAYENYEQLVPKPKIIITTGSYDEVKDFLETRGYAKYKDFIYTNIFEEVFAFYNENKLSFYECNICITSHCTLNCKNCNMRIPQFKAKSHFPLQDIKKEIDDYFAWVDEVQYYAILGGEVLLHPQIYEIVEYVAKHYRDRIAHLSVVTNGTLMPSDSFWLLLKNYNIDIQLSDYSESLPFIKDKIKTFINKMNEMQIYYQLPHYIKEGWLDYGLSVDLEESNEVLKQKFTECNNPWRCVYKGRYYYCHLEVSAVRAGLWLDTSSDSFDLSEFSPERREALLNFDLGYINGSFISYCKICNGCSAVNNNYVPTALQL